MDEEPVAVGQTATPVVDPEIRAYVYSLVTAVSSLHALFVQLETRY